VDRRPENENVLIPNHSMEANHVLEQPRIPRSVVPNTVPSMVDTQTSLYGTNAQRAAAEEPRSEPEHAQHPLPNMVVSPVASSAHQSNEENAKLNPAPDTPSSDLGLDAARDAQVVFKRERENATHLDGEELSTAHTLDHPTKPENAKPSRAPSTEGGVPGPHGAPVPNPVVKDREQRPESAITPHHSLVEDLVVDTITSRLPAMSNHAQFMEGGHNGTNGVLAARAVVVENKSEHVNAATQPPNMVAVNAQEQEARLEPATQNSAQLMADGLNGVCGENVQ
jgi:hypothetical protein